jgi:hypothetical protein
MQVEEVIVQFRRLLADYESRQFTGRMDFSVNFKQGGIGNVTADLLNFVEVKDCTNGANDVLFYHDT